MSLPTPPLTPKTFPSIAAALSGASTSTTYQYGPRTRGQSRRSPLSSPLASPDDFSLPPALETVPELEMPEASLSFTGLDKQSNSAEHQWRPGMTAGERDAREAWLSEARGRKGLRIVIVTENFLPKVDGVTRTLARLLEHLEREGHSCMLLGPETSMSHYASHPLVGTAGVPLVVYPGLKLNFLRPKFMRVIQDFQPDVIHFVDPIWLGAQTLMAMELGWAGEDWVGEGGPAIGTGISGAVVASYHTNLATYATLFGMSWLEPIMWRFQSWLYSKTLLTLCPSPSTKHMLESQGFNDVRLWPRGVDLSQFGPSKRSAEMRALWGVGEAPGRAAAAAAEDEKTKAPHGTHHSGRKLSLPLTPPASPIVVAAGTGPVFSEPEPISGPSRIVLLYVGRVSWEKNLILLLKAYGRLSAHLPAGFPVPKLVFVGDGPARSELESICADSGYDATFMGHRQGEELAACYASADVFAFPSFTETFGQVVLEALASGLPVIGLDAEGTRDLVQHGETGLLLPLPSQAVVKQNLSRTWPTICRNTSHPLFSACADSYAALLAQAATQHTLRAAMGTRACTEGIKGFTWWDAMERCVDGYRESMRTARAARQVSITIPDRESDSEAATTAVPASSSPRISRVNRALSKRLANRPRPAALDGLPRRRRHVASLLGNKADTAETLWHLKTVAKALLAAMVLWLIWTHHLASKGRELDWQEVFFVPTQAVA
ncbi:hypothetical protein Q8F55_005699 [Vanrija albida]|uniref:Glycosyl transferase family 1 domain-containing protein n=1 Tax=Vanrija albida TaxID=181172 RepID=A0ABR3Q2B8_9TREE